MSLSASLRTEDVRTIIESQKEQQQIIGSGSEQPHLPTIPDNPNLPVHTDHTSKPFQNEEVGTIFEKLKRVEHGGVLALEQFV